MLDEYDFSHAVIGKYAKQYAEGTNIVVLEPDVAKVFPDSAAVNDLRHTLVTRLGDAGYAESIIAQISNNTGMPVIMGHASVEMAYRHTHATEHGKRAAERFPPDTFTGGSGAAAGPQNVGLRGGCRRAGLP